ncbi:hypothetical protein HDU81_006486 [Chytriomyces hyalinus]|nr:hypothetical protein HDU81_006474 [Chytriomyces hyalinus]KAJ3239155.1 hypothetical protein HDU81_006486 [Chytriomyces hyalinus]
MAQAPPPVPPDITQNDAPEAPPKPASSGANVFPSSAVKILPPTVPTVSVDTSGLVKEILQSLRENDDYETGHDDDDQQYESEHQEQEHRPDVTGATETHYSQKPYSAIPDVLNADKLRFQGDGIAQRLWFEKIDYPFMQNVEEHLTHFWAYAVGVGVFLALIAVLSAAYQRCDRNKHFITGKRILKKKNSELFYSTEAPLLYR